MSLACNKPGCLLAETGKCILENDPLNCPDRLIFRIVDEIIPVGDAGDAPMQSPSSNERFASSFIMNTEQANNLMRQQYCRMVGILGTHGAGKTACLVSSYLLLAHNRLSGFRFRNSKTLRAFEEISRGARWINGEASQQLTTRTEIADERTPGFLHIRIQRAADSGDFDLLLPDLPGEWTNALIASNRTDRLSFLKSADNIWIVVSGTEINEKTTRKLAFHRVELIIERLAPLFTSNKPPITIVVTHKDRFLLKEDYFSEVIDVSRRFGFNLKIIPVASFSDSANVPPGDGMSELIEDLLTLRTPSMSKFMPDFVVDITSRNIMQFRNKRVQHG